MWGVRREEITFFFCCCSFWGELAGAPRFERETSILETDILPVKLRASMFGALARFERATSSFGNLRSKSWLSYKAVMLEWATGFEPASFGLEDRYSACWVSLTFWSLLAFGLRLFGFWFLAFGQSNLTHELFLKQKPKTQNQRPFSKNLNLNCFRKDSNLQSATAPQFYRLRAVAIRRLKRKVEKIAAARGGDNRDQKIWKIINSV